MKIPAHNHANHASIKEYWRTWVTGMALIMSLLGGCSAQSDGNSDSLEPDVDETVATVEGVPGGITRRTVTLVATVADIDYATRQVTLQDDKGNSTTVTVGPEVINFPQVKKGDRVKIAYLEEVVVYLKDKGAPASVDGAMGVAGRAPEGSKPAGMVAGTAEVTAVVTAIDLENHTATLKFPDGSSQVFPVRSDVELSNDQVGREVVIQVTTALAMSVEEM